MGEFAEGELLEVGPDRVRHVLQWRAARLRPRPPVPAEGGGPFWTGGGERANRRLPDQRRVHRRPPDRLCRRPPRWRPLHARNGFLTRPLTLSLSPHAGRGNAAEAPKRMLRRLFSGS